jgi:hypothetical protein
VTANRVLCWKDLKKLEDINYSTVCSHPHKIESLPGYIYRSWGEASGGLLKKKESNASVANEVAITHQSIRLNKIKKRVGVSASRKTNVDKNNQRNQSPRTK